MKNLFKVICSIAFMFVLGSCRKEVHEPPADTRNDNFVFVEIDGEKFMVEDRTWNFNKNTKGTFEIDNSLINVRFFQDSLIEIWFNARNTAKINNSNFRFLSIGLNMQMTKRTGGTSVRQINLDSKCYTENDSIYYVYSINKSPSGNNSYYANKSFQSCDFTILKYDELKRTIEFKISGKVENERNNKKLVPILVYIKLTNNNKL